ncbi:MAG: hypothetical protein QOG08_1658 [Chloroflexota bacterium]|nr:hypothetical protein [Chloroflexota bacterium]
MSLYSIALFLHIVGALVLFVLLTVEGVSLRQGFMAARLNRMLGPASALTILVPGIYMVVSEWGWKGWVVVGLAAWVLIAVAGAATGIGLLSGRLNVRTAAFSWSARVGMALSVVFIMTVKPDLIPSLIVVVAGAVLGAAAGSATMSRLRPA